MVKKKREYNVQVNEPKTSYLTKQTLERALRKATRNLTNDAMERMGFIVTAIDGWIVKQFSNGKIERISKIEKADLASSSIKVIGVGTGGSSAVSKMFHDGIKEVDFIVINTNPDELTASPVPLKVPLKFRPNRSQEADSIHAIGRSVSLESINEIKKILSVNTKMVFITTCLGGEAGTFGAPVIAKIAKEMGILTVAIVTMPFLLEGEKKILLAEEGLKEIREHVDTLLIFNNEKLKDMYNNMKLRDAFDYVDDILATATKNIAEIITVTLHVNLDFADVQTVMRDSGIAIMGTASCEGPNRAIRAVKQALKSPLLNNNNIMGARYVLLNITCGSDDITMDELGEITDRIQEAAGNRADIIKGYGIDESLGNRINITLIATGFNLLLKSPSTETVKTREKIKKKQPKY